VPRGADRDQHHRGGTVNPDALKLAEPAAARSTTVVADGSHVDAVNGPSPAARGRATWCSTSVAVAGRRDGRLEHDPGRPGRTFVIGYGGTLTIPTLDIISTERNIIGKHRGYLQRAGRADVCWLRRARLRCTPRHYPLDGRTQTRFADLDAGRSSRPRHSRPLGVIMAKELRLRR